MTAAIIDHLWQSTLFAIAAAMLTLALRNNSANVRFQIWLVASTKFLIPFPLLVLVGNYFRWETAPTISVAPELSLAIDKIARPGTVVITDYAAPMLPNTSMQWSIWTIILTVWVVGFVALISRWIFQWTKYRLIVKESLPLCIAAPIPVRETATVLEPGIFGIVKPILLLPKGIATQLAPEQLDAILAHELCHWRRRDNLMAAIHMFIEALFWFHPLVWWLGDRLIAERERACDEAVIQAGSDRQVYAEGILKVCQLYVEAPLFCTAGVSGGILRKRVEEIMMKQVLNKLHFAKKCVLSAVGSLAIIGPLAVGLGTGPNAAAMAQAPAVPGATWHYKSSEWNFELDIPKGWNAFPAIQANSVYEVIRFASQEDGRHLVIVFRNPYNPKTAPKEMVAEVQQILTKGEFTNFVTGETTIGSRRAYTLDFDKKLPNGETWSCRQFFVIDGTLVYVLGFGTNKRDAMFDTFDRTAKSFVLGKSSG